MLLPDQPVLTSISSWTNATSTFRCVSWGLYHAFYFFYFYFIKTNNDWSIAFKNRFNVDSAYLHFARAFDTVSHHKLIFNLQSDGITGHLLAWIKAFLTNRLQHVQVGNCLSNLINVISGVIQGSVLGPILFTIYINDISDFFTGSSVTVKLYADYAKLYSCRQCADDMHYLQLGLDFVYNCSLAWQLYLSVSKCNLLQLGRSLGTGSYTINNINLPMFHKIRDLGILIDCEINFKEHIDNITASANQCTFSIKKCFLSKELHRLLKLLRYMCAN